MARRKRSGITLTNLPTTTTLTRLGDGLYPLRLAPQALPRPEPIRRSLRLAQLQDPDIPLRGLPSREPDAPAEYRRVSARTLLPGRARRPTVTRSKDILRTLLRPVFSAHTAAKLRVCVKRTQRREVIFALGKSGRGGHRSYRRTIDSSVSCR